MLRPGGWARAVLATALVALLAIVAIAWIGRSEPEAVPSRPESERPQLMLLTSLPLVFAETLSLDAGGSPTLKVLETQYRVEPIGVADAQSLADERLLLMAHPLAQPAEALVDLDRWVRAGGRALILADPKLDWPSELPLGHPHRPPPYFADTGLLAHWGLELEPPATSELEIRSVDGSDILFRSPGRLSGACPVTAQGVVARCVIGKGMATIIADADFLQPESADEAQLAANHRFLLAELRRLER